MNIGLPFILTLKLQDVQKKIVRKKQLSRMFRRIIKDDDHIVQKKEL